MTEGPSDSDDLDGDIATPGRFFHTAATFYFLLAGAAVVWIGLDRGTIPWRLFVLPDQLVGDVLLGLGSGALIVFGTKLVQRRKPFIDLEERLRRLLTGVTPTEAVAIAMVSGFAEELFFRGAVQGSWGWVWASILFAFMHMGPDRLIGWWMLFALLAGLLFAALTLERGTLLPAVLAHATVNAVGLLRLVPGPQPSDRAS